MREEAERLLKPEYQEVCGETASPINGWSNKTGTMVTSIDVLTQKRESVPGSHPETKNQFKKPMTSRKWRIKSKIIIRLSDI